MLILNLAQLTRVYLVMPICHKLSPDKPISNQSLAPLPFHSVTTKGLRPQNLQNLCQARLRPQAFWRIKEKQSSFPSCTELKGNDTGTSAKAQGARGSEVRSPGGSLPLMLGPALGFPGVLHWKTLLARQYSLCGLSESRTATKATWQPPWQRA